MSKTILLIIDPQEDFCNPNGHLYVPGADQDMRRLADMIAKHGDRISSINVTLDSHQIVHIAHPIWWINSAGQHPNPFTVITVDDVKNGTWRATNPGMQQWSEEYVEALKTNGRYALCVWPPHCLIGSKGAAVVPELLASMIDWEMKFRKVHFVPKGSNLFTENYSAVKADVPRKDDPTTMLNRQLIDMLKSGADILIAGEALDYCIANTIRDIANEFDVSEVAKFVLLTDATSSVNAPGLEHLGKDFVNEMTAKGMRLSTTIDYFK
jgi:nicotinamidase-related amidase